MTADYSRYLERDHQAEADLLADDPGSDLMCLTVRWGAVFADRIMECATRTGLSVEDVLRRVRVKDATPDVLADLHAELERLTGRSIAPAAVITANCSTRDDDGRIA